MSVDPVAVRGRAALGGQDDPAAVADRLQLPAGVESKAPRLVVANIVR
jgi:hypothetical protein